MNWNEVPWATLLTVVGAVVVVIAGAVVTIKGSMSFDEYAKTVAGLSVGAGLLGVGRGIRRNGQPVAAAKKPAARR